MKTKDIKLALRYLFEARITPMLVGHKGVGKSSSVRDYATELDIPYIDLRLGLMDVGDLIGLPDFKEVNGKRVTTFNAPEWFPLDEDSEGVIFLDEINRARPDVLQAVFQLVLDRRIGQHVLPEGWNVVAAMNPDQDGYRVTDINDSAFISRFCHIKVENSSNDWLDYARDKKFNRHIVSFIQNQPTMLYGTLDDIDMGYVKPDGRANEMVGRILDITDVPEGIRSELIAGLIGIEASTALLADMNRAEKPVSGTEVLNDYSKVKEKIVKQTNLEDFRSDLLNDTKEQVLAELKVRSGKIDDETYGRLKSFVLDLPNDISEDFLRKFAGDPYKDIFAKIIYDEDITKKIVPAEELAAG